MPAAIAPIQTPTPPPPPSDAGAAAGPHLWAGASFSFGDLIDIINPLQHIPIVSTIYRNITGDEMGDAAKIAGGALYGGVIGLVATVVDTAVEAASGRDIATTVAAVLESGTVDPGPDGGTDVAEITGQGGGERAVAETSAAMAAMDKKAVPPPAVNSGAPAAMLAAAYERSSPPRTAGPAALPAGGGAPGPWAAFPPARLLAANPALIRAVQQGQSAFFHPGGTLNSNAALRAMTGLPPPETADETQKSRQPDTARALADYRAAARLGRSDAAARLVENDAAARRPPN